MGDIFVWVSLSPLNTLLISGIIFLIFVCRLEELIRAMTDTQRERERERESWRRWEFMLWAYFDDDKYFILNVQQL